MSHGITPIETRHTLPRERRRCLRTSLRTWVVIHGGGLTTRATIRNLSEGGAFIETVLPAVMGAQLEIRFQLPDDETEFVCTAIVRHTGTGRGIGVEFQDVGPERRQRLSRFIHRTLDRCLNGRPGSLPGPGDTSNR